MRRKASIQKCYDRFVHNQFSFLTHGNNMTTKNVLWIRWVWCFCINRRFRDRTNGSMGVNDTGCTRSSSLSSSSSSVAPASASIGGGGNAVRQRHVYIKKPLNAFMLFMKEMRQQVIDECTLKESAAINQILGRKVSCVNTSSVNRLAMAFSLHPSCTWYSVISAMA